MQIIDLQNKFAALVANLVKSPWDEIRVHYENAEIEGIPREVFTASLTSNGVKQDLMLSLDSLDVLAELRQHKPEGQSEGWLWLEFLINNTGKYKFEYKYDNPPIIMEQIKYAKLAP